MKCNYCGTTIPEGNKVCNGCGRKINNFSNAINIKVKNIEKSKNKEEILKQEKESLNNVYIQNKYASIATILSIIGIMFIPVGFIFNIIALKEVKKIDDQIEKERVSRMVKFLLVFSIMITLFTLLPIILSIY